MSDNRKYYYLKLKRNYFDDDSIVLLESMQGRCAVLQHSAQAVSEILKHGGRLSLTRISPTQRR